MIRCGREDLNLDDAKTETCLVCLKVIYFINVPQILLVFDWSWIKKLSFIGELQQVINQTISFKTGN